MTDDRIKKLEKIMYFPDLTIEAKAIYAYFCSYEYEARKPEIKDILYDLNISKSRYYKHVNILLENGLIEREYLKEKGVYSGVFYKLK